MCLWSRVFQHPLTLSTSAWLPSPSLGNSITQHMCRLGITTHESLIAARYALWLLIFASMRRTAAAVAASCGALDMTARGRRTEPPSRRHRRRNGDKMPLRQCLPLFGASPELTRPGGPGKRRRLQNSFANFRWPQAEFSVKPYKYGGFLSLPGLLC